MGIFVHCNFTLLGTSVMALSIPCPSKTLQMLAERTKANDWLASFSRSITCDATKNITIPQAMELFMNLSKSFTEKGGGFEDLGSAIKDAALPMVKPIGQVCGADKESELSSFFALTPDDVQSVCNINAVDLPEQTKDKFKEKQHVDNYVTDYYVMLLLIRRHGPNLSLIDCYYACVESREASLWQWLRTGNEKRQRLTALKVRTQKYLADTLKSKSPSLQIVDHDNEEDKKALGL